MGDPAVRRLAVFRITGTVAWLAYGAATVPDAIWFGRPWSAIGKNLFDALIVRPAHGRCLWLALAPLICLPTRCSIGEKPLESVR